MASNPTCPVSRVNPRYPGPKQAGPDGERLRLKDGALYDFQNGYRSWPASGKGVDLSGGVQRGDGTDPAAAADGTSGTSLPPSRGSASG
jgi:hypothetical protein